MVDRSLLLSVSLSGDVRLGAMLGDQLEDGFGVVASISDGVAGRLEAVEQGGHGGLVARLSWRQHKPERQTVGIDDGMDLGAQSSTRTANGVIRTPFFPPPACWWARTMEESIR